MALSDHSRSVSLICQTCAGTDFARESESPNATFTCAGCGRTYSRQALIAENGEVIRASADEMKSEIVADVRKQFQNAFRGSKYFKVR